MDAELHRLDVLMDAGSRSIGVDGRVQDGGGSSRFAACVEKGVR